MTDIRTAPDAPLFTGTDTEPLDDWTNTECTITADEWAEMQSADSWDDLLAAILCEA